SLTAWAGIVLVLTVLLAILAPWFGPDPAAIDVTAPTAPMGTPDHWLGTDDLGRDMLSRLGLGARISLFIGISAALVAVGLGTLYGMVSATFEGAVDTVMMRFLDILYSLPGLMVVILVAVFVEPVIGLWSADLHLPPGTGRVV